MDKHLFTIAPGVVIEYIGNEALVLLPGSSSVLKIAAEQVETLRAIESGHLSGVSRQRAQALIDAGIVVSHTAMSRRTLIASGAVGAGVAVLAMPGVAAASSHHGTNSGPSDGATGGGASGDTPDLFGDLIFTQYSADEDVELRVDMSELNLTPASSFPIALRFAGSGEEIADENNAVLDNTGGLLVLNWIVVFAPGQTPTKFRCSVLAEFTVDNVTYNVLCEESNPV